MFGVIANAARHEPEAVAALRAGRDDRVSRLLRLPLPEPYVPTRLEAVRDRLRTPGTAASPRRRRQDGSQAQVAAMAADRAAGTTAQRPTHAEARPGERAGTREGDRASGRQRPAGRRQQGDGPAHWKVSVSGERSDPSVDRGAGRRHRGAHRAGDGRGRCVDRARPDGPDHRARAPRAAWKPAWSPSAATTSSSSPPVPLPRKPSADLLRLPLRVRRAVRADPRGARRGATPTSSSGSAGTSRCPPTWPPAAACARRRVPVVVHEANASAGIANKVGARSRAPGAGRGRPIRACGASRWSGSRCARRSPRSTGPRCAREARATSASPRTPGCCWCSADPRVRSRSTGPSRGAAEALAAAGVSVLHAHGPKNTLDVAATRPRAPPYVAVPYLDRMDLAYAAADLAICRSGAMTVAEVVGGRPARGLRAAADRQRRAATQRAAGGRRRAAACWSPTPT